MHEHDALLSKRLPIAKLLVSFAHSRRSCYYCLLPRLCSRRVGVAAYATEAHVATATVTFYAPQLYRQVLLRRVLAMGILSVRPSVTTRWYTKTRSDRDSGSSAYDSLESVVSNEVIWCRWVRRFPSNEGIKQGYPP